MTHWPGSPGNSYLPADSLRRVGDAVSIIGEVSVPRVPLQILVGSPDRAPGVGGFLARGEDAYGKRAHHFVARRILAGGAEGVGIGPVDS